jgi:hypothetical protein
MFHSIGCAIFSDMLAFYFISRGKVDFITAQKGYNQLALKTLVKVSTHALFANKSYSIDTNFLYKIYSG